jgi:hypothetical protein
MTARFLILVMAAGCVFAEGAGYRIYSSCDEGSDVRAEIQKETPLTVQFSVAGDSPCYSVAGTVDGKAVRGYVLDATLDSVRAFDGARVKNDKASFEAIELAAVNSAPKTDPAKAKEGVAKTDPKPAKKDPPTPKMSM